MQEIIGNVFDLIQDPTVDAICITTNGITNNAGLAVMGAGTAGEAARRWPEIRVVLGKYLQKYGNKPFIIGEIDKNLQFCIPNSSNIRNADYKCLIWSFPTKHHFMKNSDITLIQQSATLLAKYSAELGLKKIILPRPGCSNGKLNWQDVKPVIENILDDRFYVCSFEGE